MRQMYWIASREYRIGTISRHLGKDPAKIHFGVQSSTAEFKGVAGATIIGSSTHANQMTGSLGNGVITASTVGGDTIKTGGGGDTINLHSHSSADSIQLTMHFGSLVVTSQDAAQAGYWGIPPSGAGAGIPIASTSADQSVISGFNAGVDFLQFALADWGGAKF
jgi:hypothetical protein